MAEAIVRDLAPRSVLDARLETGLLVEALRDRGVKARRVDSLTEPPEGRYDLVICLGTLERVSAAEAESAIANICAVTDAVLVSATPPNAALLADQGFLLDVESDLSQVSAGASLYRRDDEPLAEVVRRYERDRDDQRRELARRDDEIGRLRELLVARDTELGKAKGRLTEIDDNPLRFSAATLRARYGPRATLRRTVAALRRRLGGGTGP